MWQDRLTIEPPFYVTRLDKVDLDSKLIENIKKYC